MVQLTTTKWISVSILQKVSVGYWIDRSHVTYLFVDDDPPLMAYLAACSLSSQSTHAILDFQTGTLSSNLSQEISQSWNLWSPGTNESKEFAPLVGCILSQTRPPAWLSWLAWYHILLQWIWNLPTEWVYRLLHTEQVCISVHWYCWQY